MRSDEAKGTATDDKAVAAEETVIESNEAPAAATATATQDQTSTTAEAEPSQEPPHLIKAEDSPKEPRATQSIHVAAEPSPRIEPRFSRHYPAGGPSTSLPVKPLATQATSPRSSLTEQFAAETKKEKSPDSTEEAPTSTRAAIIGSLVGLIAVVLIFFAARYWPKTQEITESTDPSARTAQAIATADPTAKPAKVTWKYRKPTQALLDMVADTAGLPRQSMSCWNHRSQPLRDQNKAHVDCGQPTHLGRRHGKCVDVGNCLIATPVPVQATEGK